MNTPFNSRITGTGSAYPQKRVTNHDLAKTIETNDEWIQERTGIVERRISDLRIEGERNSSLAYQASLKALEMAGKTASDIDAIFYATCTPDTIVPSAACWLQLKLGAKRAWAVDLNAACSGFVYALSMADQHIRTGQMKTILVIGAEVMSTLLDWTDRTTCILFGDGAGAAVLTQVPAQSSSRILSTHLLSDGTLWELFNVPAGGSNQEITEEVRARHDDKMKMKGKEIYKVAVKTLSEFAVQAVEANGLKTADVDWIVPHQANLRIIEAVAKRLSIPMSKMLVNIDRYGNTSAGTVPTALDEGVRDGRIKVGDLVLLDVFGAGLTYGSILLRW